MKIEFYKHNIGTEEKNSLLETLDSIFLTTGPKTTQFESDFRTYLGTNYATGVTSWTTGAFLVLKAWGIGPEDEIITTPLSFCATANVILQVGAKPIFVDVDPTTGNLDINLVEQAITLQTKAIIPVHLYGQMVDMKSLRKIADKHNLKILEDCAHCIEGARDSIKPGQLGDAAVFSFYATKNIASGEGGMIATNHQELYEKLLLLRLHGMDRSAIDRYTGLYRHWDMSVLGYKANMFDIQAALLIPQLKKIEDHWKAKQAICEKYEQAFGNQPNLDFPKVLANSKSARHIFTIWVPADKRDLILKGLQDKGIGVAVNFRVIHLLKYYRENLNFKENDFPIAESIGNRTITLPLYPKLTSIETDYIIDSVLKTVETT
ncbi:MAG: DegT/DnrJ/EryC1/StrS family aminotransferase [Candidatus Omnitrophica bacterium]|nr:DegT/DnrJ/EryC1/StrS family aminotransferase [Candidatus Omnitrophota bacterium]